MSLINKSKFGYACRKTYKKVLEATPKKSGTPCRMALSLLILPTATASNACSNVGGAFISTFITSGVVLVG